MTTKNVTPLTGDVIIPGEDRLAGIADDIRAEFGKGIDAQFAIGRLLIEAHSLMPDDREYGRWFAAQKFPFKKGTAFLLQRGAEREDDVREFIAARGQENERDIGVPYAIQLLTSGPKEPYTPPGYAPGESAPPTTAMDPAFVALRDAGRLILGYVPDGQGGGEYTGNLFTAMHVDDLAESARTIQLLAAAYTEAKHARTT